MKNWSLSQKIWSVLVLLAVAFIISTVFSITRLSDVRDSLVEITSRTVKRDQIAAEIRDNQRLIVTSIMEIILAEKNDTKDENNKIFTSTVEKQNADMEKYDSLAKPEGKEILKRYQDVYSQFLKTVQRSRDLALQNKAQEATEIYLSSKDLLEKMRLEIIAMNKLTEHELKDRAEKADGAANQAITLGMIIASVSIFLSMLIAFFVLRAVTRSINRIVKDLFDSSVQVSSASAQIASSSEELSQAATEQAASLEETAASIEEMNSMVAKNSENANSTASTSSKSQDKAAQGKLVVERMIQSMGEIDQSNNAIMDQVNRSNESISSIVKVIEEIGSKTKVINDIVFQTKLLSFNASVEAARAGEHGKGFAVVAEEVGNLAQMSGNAAKEISTLLDESLQKVNDIVEETKVSVEKLIAQGKKTVESGSLVARECGGVLEEIVHNVNDVSAMAGEIASASQEQARGVGEITKAMSQLDQMTQQNASTSEECASAAEELSAQAETLKNAVGQLVATISGAKSQMHHHHQLTEENTPRPATKAKPSSTPHSSSSKPTAKASSPNVVHLKRPRLDASDNRGTSQKASGGIPDYHSNGFEEI